MKKIFKKFWGVALVVMMLSSLLIIPATPAGAGEYALSDSFMIPGGIFDISTVMAPAGSVAFGILDVAQSGSTIYAVGDATGVEYLYKSTDGGATWALIATPAAPTANTHGLPSGAGATWGLVAVAQDDPDIVAVVNTFPGLADVVYLSLNGGVLFQALTATAADLNGIDISSAAPVRYIAIGGNTVAPAEASAGGYLASWTIGALVGAWNAVAGLPACDDVEAVAYSEGFIGDQILMCINETVAAGVANGDVSLHIYSYNTAAWDAAIDVSFPRVLESSVAPATLTCARATFTLDTNFTLADESLEIGFIGADITTPAATQAGGVYRIGTYTIVGATYVMTQIMVGTAINSVAWDGTNLMAAQRGAFATGLAIWRSANALTVFAAFSKNSALKTPGTGNSALVLFNGDAGYCFSQGNNSAIAKTTDYGKSFNGVALVNSNFGTIHDVWISPDGGTMYATVGDGTDLNIWRYQGFVWERIAILNGASAQVWLVRADADNPQTVYIGRQGAWKNMYKSLDGGDFIWTARSCSQNIQDFVVQDADTVYVAVNGNALVVKTITGGFTWTNPPTVVPFATGGGNCYSITLLSDNHVLIGGVTGGVAYTTDGATWTGMVNAGAGTVVLTATGLDTGDSVFAAVTGVLGAVKRWTFGTNLFAWTGGQALNAAAVDIGIAYANGVLYVLDNVGGFLYRLLQPLVDFTAATGTEAFATIPGTAYTQGVNKLSATTMGTTNMVWAVNAAAIDTLDNFIDYLTSASNAPTLVYPLDNDKISVNSINGAVSGFVFKWNAPAVVSLFGTVLTYNYNLEVYLDEAGTIPVAGSPIAAVFLAATPAPTLSVGSAAIAGWAPVPGETYYWRVRVMAAVAGSALSYWSEMHSFTIQQLGAIVPVISAPTNGSTVETLSPGFSWEPIAGATLYEFQLAKGATFAVLVYSDNTTTSGESLPVTIELEDGQQYYWRVRVVEPSVGEWSQVGIFTVMIPVPTPTTPPVTPTVILPTPTVIVPTQPAPTVTVIVPTPTTETKEISPAYIWAIIIIGAILVIAVIVLIVRTRRSV
jgi:hypothetical protein